MRRRISGLLLLCASFVASAAWGCEAPHGGLPTSRIVQLDASTGPIYGQISRYKRDPDFLEDKEVVLTFDDGPLPRITRPILRALRDYCAKATFFPVGRMATAYPRVMREIVADGHSIGAHTWSHPRNLRRLKKASVTREIEKGFAAVALAAQSPVAPFFRFPGLNDDRRALAYLKRRGVATLSVDIVSNDSYARDAETLARTTLRRIDEAGRGIVLFHDIKEATVQALPVILKGLKEHGYSVVHLTSKFAFTPLTTYDSELSARLAKRPKPQATVSLAGLHGTIRPQDPTIEDGPPVTLLAPAARKLELVAAHQRRRTAATKGKASAGWAIRVDQSTGELLRQ